MWRKRGFKNKKEQHRLCLHHKTAVIFLRFPVCGMINLYGKLHIPSGHPERNFSLQYFFQKLCHFTQRRKSHLSLPSGKHLRFFLIRRELFQLLLQGIQFFFDPPHIKIPGDCAKLPLHIRIIIQICQDRMIQVLIGCLPLLT